MCKFIVVLYRHRDFTRERFLTYLRDIHGPMAEQLPGLAAYRQNHVTADDTRRDPGWDAIVELCWPTRDQMERAWRSPAGKAATADLEAFVDLHRTTWAIVDEQVRRPAADVRR